MNGKRIFVINPGSTSTKIGIYVDDKEIMFCKIEHSIESIKRYRKIVEQFDMRLNAILKVLDEKSIDLSTFDAISARGGSLKPVKGGIYIVDKNVLEDLSIGISGEHASSLGGLLAFRLADKYRLPSYIVDPDVIDEMCPYAKITGFPGVMRKSRFHALNQKAVGRYYAKEIKQKYEDLNLIVAHLGGGISVAAHQKGEIIDVNDTLEGDGPYSPERAGSMPSWAILDMCYSGRYTKEEAAKRLNGQGGIVAHLHTNNVKEVKERRANGDQDAALVYEGMAYKIAKEIGAIATTIEGKVNAIIFTGGISFDSELIELIKKRVSFIADITVFPGEFEMQALAAGALRVLNNEEAVKKYPSGHTI